MPIISTLQGVLLATGISSIATGFLVYNVSTSLERSKCEHETLDTAIKYAKNADDRLEALREELKAESKAAIESAKKKAALEGRQIRERIVYETVLVNRPECVMPDDAWRVLNEAINRANTTLGYGESNSVSSDMPTDPASSESK